jgi:hypothetical protein
MRSHLSLRRYHYGAVVQGKSKPVRSRAVSFSAFAVEFGPELQIPDSKFQNKGRKQPDFESGICNLESIPSANIGE